MHPKFKDGSSVTWQEGRMVWNGVVVRGSSASVDIVPVFRLENDTRCYDEGGSNSIRDRDNVRLKDCPPPFSDVCENAERKGCFAVASMETRFTMSESEIVSQGLDFTPDGTHISDRDFADVLDHFWRDEKEHGIGFKQDPPQRSPKMAALFRKYD